VFLEKQRGWLFTGDIMLTWEVWGQLSDGDFAPSASLSVYYESLMELQKRKSEISCIFPAHGKKEGNPEGCTEYTLPPSVIDIYCKNIARILKGEVEGELYVHPTRGGKLVRFEIGGIVYNVK
jgi:Zn-dependent hydrolases, including glyoxylases